MREAHKYLKKLKYKGYTFNINPETYEPSDDTFLLVDNIHTYEGDVVLDMGTGCGIAAIIAAERVKDVVAVDVNPSAAKCAHENVKVNRLLGKVHVIVGDLFNPLRSSFKFNLLLFNPPYLPVERGEVKGWIEVAWAGGLSGRGLVDRFIEQAPSRLRAHGRIQLVQSSLSGIEETLRRLKELGFKARVMASKKLPFEELTLIHGLRISCKPRLIK